MIEYSKRKRSEIYLENSIYGIGLSIASDICTRYRGSIKAEWRDGAMYFTAVI